MKKLLLSFILLLLLLLVCSNSQAANYYFDLASGNDTTGDGTSGNPWKTIDKCTTSRSAGDECRGAKTAITTLSGTLTFTNGSTTVNTSEDLTAVVAANDIIGKNSGMEGWWSVASVTSSAITLTYEYWGLSGSGSAVTGYKITPVTASEEYDINTDGISGSLITVSGGWDLSGGPTQNGVTVFSSSYTNGIDTNGKDFVKISKFIIVAGSSYGILIGASSTDCEVSDCWILHGSTAGLSYGLNAFRPTISNLVVSGGTGSGISLTLVGTYQSIYSFSSGTGTGDYGAKIGNGIDIDDLRVYNSYSSNLSLESGSSGSFISNGIFVKTRSSSNITLSTVSDIRFHNATISNAATYVASSGTTVCLNIYFIECTITAGSSGLFNRSTTYHNETLVPMFIYKEIGSDSIMYFGRGTIEHDSSADARSGKALKFSPDSITYCVKYKVGSVAIPSASSDITLYAYLKDDVSFDGEVIFSVYRNGKLVSSAKKTPTTSYVQNSVVVDSSDLVVGEYLDLYVTVNGTAGNVWIDDFSADQ